MGGGSWTPASFASYTVATKGVTADEFRSKSYSAQSLYSKLHIQDTMNPFNVVRECVDTEEHRNTVPVILALDVTGSMGSAAVKVAQCLNDIITNIYSNESVKDIEFCVMGIGDVECDEAPIQISQFESDIRIAEHLDNIYFEGRGGGNSYESYSAAWYMGLNRCKLDCWNRGKKGIIITLGDELPNPFLSDRMFKFIGGQPEKVETKKIYKEASQKFDIYHISIDDGRTSYSHRSKMIDKAWYDLIGDNYHVSDIDALPELIAMLVESHNNITATNSDVVSW